VHSKPSQGERSYQPRVTLQAGTSGGLALYCVPGAGASVTYFCGLADALGSRNPVYGLQPRGLDGLQPPYVDVPTAASAYIEAIREDNEKSPYCLLGHSFGGWVVFEMACQLLERGCEVANVVILDSRAPCEEERRTHERRVEVLLRLVRLYEQRGGRSAGLASADLEGLEEEQQLRKLQQGLVESQLLPASLDRTIFLGIVRVFEAGLQSRYLPPNAYPGPLHVFVAAERDNDVREPESRSPDQFLGWRRLAPRATSSSCPGNHMTMLALPHVQRLADALRSRISLGGVK
jgi:thioesterase domain-containing protein